MYANASPTQRCLPAPKDKYANAPPALSSALRGANRSGSYLSGPRVAEQHQRGRVQAQGFLDAAVQGVHLLEDVVVDAVPVPRHDPPLLLDRGAQVLGVGDEARPGPGARAGAVVLPREGRGDEHPDDLRLRRPTAVLVPGVDQALQHVVGCLAVAVGAALAGPDDLGEYLA
jgi:hypothetical protein